MFEDRFEVSHGFRTLDLGSPLSSTPSSGLSSNSSSPSLLLPFNSSRQSIKQCFSFSGKPFDAANVADNNRLNNPFPSSNNGLTHSATSPGSLSLSLSSASLAIGAEKKLGLQSLNANVQALQAAQNAQNQNQNNNNSKVNTSRYKTELCRPFQENGTCKYGEKCQFAHGMAELRSISRHPKYKTDLCRTYHSVGFCPYGPRCHFVHNLDEVKPPTAANNNVNGRSNGPAYERHGSVSSNCSSASSESGSTSPKMPPLPMFNLGGSGFGGGVSGGGRTRNYSEVSSGSGGSHGGSPASTDHDSDSDLAVANRNLAGSPSRLPVFTHLSK